jgi:hypothetical protein
MNSDDKLPDKKRVWVRGRIDLPPQTEWEDDSGNESISPFGPLFGAGLPFSGLPKSSFPKLQSRPKFPGGPPLRMF